MNPLNNSKTSGPSDSWRALRDAGDSRWQRSPFPLSQLSMNQDMHLDHEDYRSRPELAAYYSDHKLMWRNVILIGISNFLFWSQFPNRFRDGHR